VGGSSVVYKVDGATFYTATTNVPTSAMYPGARHQSLAGQLDFDWMIVRKHNATEPTSSFGAEQNN